MNWNAIVSDSLIGKKGYVKWSIQMKTYLMSQDLWDIIVDADHEPDATGDEAQVRAWRKKNAVVLHAIQISCDGPAFALIQDINSAKIAWDTLASTYSKDKIVGDCNDSEIESEDDSKPVLNEVVGFHRYEPLLKAVQIGDWKAAEGFLAKHPDAVSARITFSGKNALHVAVAAGHVHIVEKLVGLMTEEDLEMKRGDGMTAFAIAVEFGNISIAECLIRKNKKLVRIHVYGRLPVVHAGCRCQPHMARFLYSVTPLEDLISLENGKQGSELMSLCVQWKQFDIALHLLERCPRLAITPFGQWRSPVVSLAHSRVFASVGQLRFWQRWIYDRIHVPDCAKNHISIDVKTIDDTLSHKDITVIRSGVFQPSGRAIFGLSGYMVSCLLKLLDVKHIYELKSVHVQAHELLNRMCKVIASTSDHKLIIDAGVHGAMIPAVHCGNVELIKSLAKANPELLWPHHIALNVFSYAIQIRQAEVFSLIYGLHDKQAIIASCTTMPPPPYKPGPGSPPLPPDPIPRAALQIQRDLQWCKEVETIFSLTAPDCWNKDYLQPYASCMRDHKALVTAGKEWMRDKSQSCIIVGVLITTIMFAAAFLVPAGGNNQDTNIPVLVNRKLFELFNALSLFSSTISMLMFIGIHTSRFAREDFLKSLPTKMIIGLSTLFFSIATMIIAFSAILSTMFLQDSRIGSAIILLAGIPITLSFMMMDFPLLVDIVMSTYGPSIFNRKVKPWM